MEHEYVELQSNIPNKPIRTIEDLIEYLNSLFPAKEKQNDQAI